MKQAILELLRDYQSRTMKSAENLYVGYDTWDRIRAEMTQGEIWPNAATHVNRPMCLGLWVFVVNADEHLKVG
jgi:hypothetical protein